MLQHFVKFDEKLQNWPTLVILYNVIRDTHHFLTLYEKCGLTKNKLQNLAPGQNFVNIFHL